MLRLVVEHLNLDAGVVNINGEELLLPPCVTGENGARLVDIPLKIDHLKAINHLSFKLAADHRPGFHLICSSILLSTSDSKID